MPAASYVFGQISQLLAPCCLSRSALSFVSRQSRPARDKLQQAKMLHNAAAAAGVAKLSQVDESLESRLMWFPYVQFVNCLHTRTEWTGEEGPRTGAEAEAGWSDICITTWHLNFVGDSSNYSSTQASLHAPLPPSVRPWSLAWLFWQPLALSCNNLAYNATVAEATMLSATWLLIQNDAATYINTERERDRKRVSRRETGSEWERGERDLHLFHLQELLHAIASCESGSGEGDARESWIICALYVRHCARHRHRMHTQTHTCTHTRLAVRTFWINIKEIYNEPKLSLVVMQALHCVAHICIYIYKSLYIDIYIFAYTYIGIYILCISIHMATLRLRFYRPLVLAATLDHYG